MAESQTIFQLVRKVLDQLKADVVDAHGKNADAAIGASLVALRKAYSNLTDPDRPPVDYTTPENRFAYVYRYVGAHSDYVYQILGHTEKLVGNHLASREKIVVTALGGGPGTELVGLTQYLVEHEKCNLRTVTAYLLDAEQGWADCWTEIGEEVSAKFSVHTAFQQLDVTSADSWAKQKKFLSADLFLLVYFVSEIASLGDAADQMWADLATKTKNGAYMIVVDNNSQFCTDYVNSKLVSKGWDVISIEAKKLTPSYQEEKTDLGDHLSRYGEMPKLKGNLMFWVLKRKA